MMQIIIKLFVGFCVCFTVGFIGAVIISVEMWRRG